VYRGVRRPLVDLEGIIPHLKNLSWNTCARRESSEQNHQRQGPTCSLDVGLVLHIVSVQLRPTQNSRNLSSMGRSCSSWSKEPIKDQEENHVRVTLKPVNRLLKCIAYAKSANKVYSALLLTERFLHATKCQL
jgi:hypothetical protein